MTRQVQPMRGPLSAAALVTPLPTSLTARRLRDTDGARLGRLMADGYRGTIDDPGEDDVWFRADAAATLTGEYGRVLHDASPVALDGEQFVGACVVTDIGEHLLLAFALVVPGWRNRGLGAALIARSAQSLLDAGHREWTLAVTVGNPAARLYERLGFVVDESLRSGR